MYQLIIINVFHVVNHNLLQIINNKVIDDFTITLLQSPIRKSLTTTTGHTFG